MKKSAIFLSDLHLGRDDQLEDFAVANQNAFIKFLREYPTWFATDELDLVFLGDTFDIWQVAEDDEKTAAQSTSIPMDFSAQAEADRMARIVQSHSGFFAALRDFLTPASHRRIVFTPGNHDHALVAPAVQTIVRDGITPASTLPPDAVCFSEFYNEPRLGVYGEHGNQIDPNNAYKSFPSLDKEAKGFYFVRSFWNRVETVYPSLDVWWKSFDAIIKRKLWKAIPLMAKCWCQYLADHRFDHVSIPSILVYDAVPSAYSEIQMAFPDVLLAGQPQDGRFFSSDPLTEEALRALYHDPANPGFRVEADALLKQQYLDESYTVPVARPIVELDAKGLFGDAYKRAVNTMFSDSTGSHRYLPLKGVPLDVETYSFVVLGHTHGEKMEKLPGRTAQYINTGSWSTRLSVDGRNISRLCYTRLMPNDAGEIEVEQECWPLEHAVPSILG